MKSQRVIAGALCAAMALASCSSNRDDRPEMGDERGGPPGEGGGQQGMMQPPRIPEEAETWEGIFVMEDGIFPTLEEEDGTAWHLILEFPFTEDMLPKEGKDILVKAVASKEYPDRLTVCYLEVEGKVVEPELPDRGQGGGPPGGDSGGPGNGGGPGQ